ncbi:ketoacyl-ACP synthase III [bacterium]|nr:ketoacyl-ACP synthase III [bacterium]
MTEIFTKIVGTGSYLPSKVLTNDDLSKMVETSDEWIFPRTGIKERHIADDNELTSDLATNAAKRALESSNVKAEDIDLIILATTTPDLSFPSTACRVQANLGCVNAAAFDMQAVCSGFIYALTVADKMIKSGEYKKALVIGAETLSRIVDWNDRTTCVLFGDGAGAVVVEATTEKTGILSSIIKADPSYYDILKTTGGVSATKNAGSIYMEGKEVFKLAVSKMPEVSAEAVKNAGLSLSDVDCFIPHQANVRIIDAALKHLDIAEEKTVKTLQNQGNTSAASIPIALDWAVRNGMLKKGNNALLTAMGGGFTWGAVVFKF